MSITALRRKISVLTTLLFWQHTALDEQALLLPTPTASMPEH